MTTRILVTGGTGTLGRHVVPMLRDSGAPLRVLSRGAHPSEGSVEYHQADLIKGEGVESAVAGIEVVLHLAGGPKGDDVATRNLMRAAQRAEVRHLVFISIIGVDRVPLGFYKTKFAAERLVTRGSIPWTVLRAAQFHDLVLKVVRAMARSPLVLLPSGMRLQPVDAADVAARLVELTQADPAGMVPELAGPRIYPLRELVEVYLRAAGKRRLMVPIRLPGKIGRAYRAGENLAPDAVKGKRTWEEFVAGHSLGA